MQDLVSKKRGVKIWKIDASSVQQIKYRIQICHIAMGFRMQGVVSVVGDSIDDTMMGSVYGGCITFEYERSAVQCAYVLVYILPKPKGYSQDKIKNVI